MNNLSRFAQESPSFKTENYKLKTPSVLGKLGQVVSLLMHDQIEVGFIFKILIGFLMVT